MLSQKFVIQFFLSVIIKRRTFFLINFLLILVLAVVYAFFIAEKEFQAQVTFLPPSPGESALSISSLTDFPFSSLSGSNILSDQIEIIFTSKNIKRKVIEKFDLIKKYKLLKNPNKFENAAKILDDKLELESTEKGNIGFSKTLSYSISCLHSSPDTSQMIVDFCFSLIDSAIRNISIDRASRNRKFVEAQLSLNHNKYDSLQKVFEKFQIENKAYDIPEQLHLSLKTYAEIKSADIFNDLKIMSLKREFKTNTPEILALQSNSYVYKEKLKEIENKDKPDVLSGLNLSTSLLPKYSNILKEMEIQNQLVLLLTKEFEQTKLQESKDISPLIIIDPSYIPEYKSKPKRLFLMVSIVGLYLFSIFVFIFSFELFINRNKKFDFFLKNSLANQ